MRILAATPLTAVALTLGGGVAGCVPLKSPIEAPAEWARD